MAHTVPEISLKQMRMWRRRLGMSEEEIVTRHAVFCTKYPGGKPWQYPAGASDNSNCTITIKFT